jgi:CMP/dCMP kinase
MQVIAIDGPAASGKSSVARRLAAQLGYLHVNTGNHYRAVTLAVLHANVDPQDADAVAAQVPALDLAFVETSGTIEIRVNGASLADADLTSPAVTAAVSHVASVPAVRTRLVQEQRALSALGPLVMEGRDIGSVVFPDSPNKFYIDASEEVRAARRASQGLTDSLAERDKLDSTRKTAPLVLAEGAHRIDSSEMTLDQVVATVTALLK